MAVSSDRLQLFVGDITKLEVDAVVNAANTSLRGGGGVDGAIHRAAGPALLEECLKIGGCPTGEARITKGHRLRAEWIIHAVGPVYRGGTHGEADLLANCYRASLQLAEGHGLNSIAFPCISTGIYGYPKSEACAIAVSTVLKWIALNAQPCRVIFCCFAEDDAEVYRNRLADG